MYIQFTSIQALLEVSVFNSLLSRQQCYILCFKNTEIPPPPSPHPEQHCDISELETESRPSCWNSFRSCPELETTGYGIIYIILQANRTNSSFLLQLLLTVIKYRQQNTRYWSLNTARVICCFKCIWSEAHIDCVQSVCKEWLFFIFHMLQVATCTSNPTVRRHSSGPQKLGFFFLFSMLLCIFYLTANQSQVNVGQSTNWPALQKPSKVKVPR